MDVLTFFRSFGWPCTNRNLNMQLMAPIDAQRMILHLRTIWTLLCVFVLEIQAFLCESKLSFTWYTYFGKGFFLGSLIMPTIRPDWNWKLWKLKSCMCCNAYCIKLCAQPDISTRTCSLSPLLHSYYASKALPKSLLLLYSFFPSYDFEVFLAFFGTFLVLASWHPLHKKWAEASAEKSSHFFDIRPTTLSRIENGDLLKEHNRGRSIRNIKIFHFPHLFL